MKCIQIASVTGQNLTSLSNWFFEDLLLNGNALHDMHGKCCI